MKISTKVYAIVVVYNGIYWLEKCIVSLRNSSIPLNIIAIDNNSSDGSADYIEMHFPEIELIRSEKNLGFGGANNLGLRRAVGDNADFVFLLNQDAWIESNTIINLINILERQSSIGIVAPFQFSYEGEKIENYFNDYILGQYTPHFMSDLYFGKQRVFYETSFIHAAAWLLSISTVKLIGGFDPIFHHYGEDQDYVQRLQDRGLSIGFVTDAYVYHFGTNEGLHNPGTNIRHLTNSVVLTLKHPKSNLTANLVLFIKRSLNSITSSLICRDWKQIRINIEVSWNVLRMLPKIKSSRRLQRFEGSFLRIDNK